MRSGPVSILLAAWLPVAAWMAVILCLSGQSFSGERSGSLFAALLEMLFGPFEPRFLDAFHFALRKAAHFLEYGVLALLVRRALHRSVPHCEERRAAGLALALSIAWACFDETRQLFEPERYGLVADVLLDAAGACFFLLSAGAWRRTELWSAEPEVALWGARDDRSGWLSRRSSAS